MKEFFKQNGVFVGLSLILVIVLGLALLYIPKGELHLLLCDRHTPARDIFFRYYTHVAEWFPYVVCMAVLLFGRIGDGVFASSAMLLSALSTQVIKHIVNAPRPVIWFGNNMPEINLPLVEGVKMNLWFSFPSGHTTSFFALAFVVGILMSQKWPKYGGLIQVVLFVLATLGGYSRIYLSQHFSADVFAGVIVGVCITILCYVVFNRYKDQKWFNFRLIAKK
ncbi:MAG: phosphatase PAP2 family protein [Prevotella sp.]|nr:phosphatase PAP2 family protein [Prevotella sp.]